eukprot:4306585-Pleurochrysis_carterae.AAC.1
MLQEQFALLEGHPQIFVELLRRVGLRAALHVFSALANPFAGRGVNVVHEGDHPKEHTARQP